MLIYHPAYDAYHCVFRALLLTNSVQVLEVAKLRILDFFLCFPSELSRVRLPKDHTDARRLAQSLRNEYHGPVSMRHTFREMEHIQLAAFRTLAASTLVDAAELSSGLIRRTTTAIPQDLTQRIADAMEANREVVSYLTKRMVGVPLLGVDGLKHRTGLMEYRYDIV